MGILIFGHTGFLGKLFLDFLNEHYPESLVVGISKESSSVEHHGTSLVEYPDFDVKIEEKIDLVFNFTHSQNERNVCKAEEALAMNIINFIKNNHIDSPIVLLRSVGTGSDHIRSRQLFDDLVKTNLNNRIIEIRSSIIEEEGSVSYEIPYRVIRKLRTIPKFPWMDNKVSLVKVSDILNEFKKIIEGEQDSDLVTPAHRTMTYKEYVEEVAGKEGVRVSFVEVPFNDFFFTPFFVKLITGLDYYLVKNLMMTLRNDSVL